MFKVFSLTILAVHALVSATDAPLLNPPATGPAGCLVQVGDRILMVRDIWSHRWGLPGGGHDAGETAQQTAVREKFEETGLRVIAGPLVWTSQDNFSVYRCEPGPEGIPVHPDGTLVLPKEGYDELIEARLVHLRDIPDARLRYPSQRASLLAAMTAPDLTSESVLRAPPPLGRLFTTELPAIRALQDGIAQLLGTPGGDLTMRALSQLGNAAAVMVVLIVLWFLVGWRAGVELAYALLLTCLLGLIAKQYFGWPRPFHVDPSLQREAAQSFGFPSGHTVCATTLWGLVAYRVRGAGRLCAALVAACALSRVALGVHYIHDVLAGAVLGVTACVAYHVHLTFHRDTQVSLRAWRTCFAIVGTAALVVCPQPPTIAICSLLLSLTLGTWWLERWDAPTAKPGKHWSLREDAGRGAWQAGMVLAMASLLLAVAPLAVPAESSFLPYLWVHIATYLLIGALPPLAQAAAHALQRPGACASHPA